MNKITIPEGLKGKELFKFLIENKHLLITQKKSAVKQSDSVTCKNLYVNSKGEITKAAPKPTDTGVIEVVSVINTTNLMDSHDDVHIPGIWNRNLKQNNQLYLTEEHDLSFRGIISRKVKAHVQSMTWKSLGAEYTGKTEALIFTSLVEENRNKFMYDLYKADEVPNHSVGMQYVNLLLAINDEDFKEEFANWNEYIDQVANKDDAEENGFFWPVLEAKVVEGAAVLKGSNWVTPTLEVDAKSLNTDEPDPLKGTQQHRPFDVSEAIKKTKFF
jgi:hypothetical protein